MGYFKKIKDLHGHEVGDLVLVRIASTIRAIIREVDVLARWGGEEFLVLLPDCNLKDAKEKAERLRQAIESMTVEAGTDSISTSVSIGIAALKENEQVNAAVGRADKALYISKANGRNQITVSE